MPLQGKLLRALQESEFEPLGSNRVVHADVRIIAATSMDLPAMVAQGRFRADLYYRLNVLTIPVPALRERLSDIETLSYSVLDKLCAQHHTGHLDEAALRLLKAHGWPGNVRELHNTLERTVMFSDGRASTPARSRDSWARGERPRWLQRRREPSQRQAPCPRRRRPVVP